MRVRWHDVTVWLFGHPSTITLATPATTTICWRFLPRARKRLCAVETGVSPLPIVTDTMPVEIAEADEAKQPLTLTAEESIGRFLQYVLPGGFQKVRHFGLQHKRSKTKRGGLRCSFVGSPGAAA
jgi:hypothetical protein